jgi:hypothetical protein
MLKNYFREGPGIFRNGAPSPKTPSIPPDSGKREACGALGNLIARRKKTNISPITEVYN